MATIHSVSGTITDNRNVLPIGDIDGAIAYADNSCVDSLIGNYTTRIGVSLAPDQAVETLEPLLSELNLVVLNFPTFADGRAFSQAHLLRSRYGYAGDLRATGEVVQDQLAFMLSCGFNQFELPSVDESLDFVTALTDARQFANFIAGTGIQSTGFERQVST